MTSHAVYESFDNKNVCTQSRIIINDVIRNKIKLKGIIISEDISGISSISNNAPEFFPLGETIVTWTATDTSGN